MGYTTEFYGEIAISPPLSETEIAYLRKFAGTRRILCKNGPYYVDRDFGQDRDSSVINYNEPAEGQPSLWCQWEPTDDGAAIKWNETEKFYCAAEWMKYLIDHFVGTSPLARAKFPFFMGHKCNGEIDAVGEDSDDRWRLTVEDNVVRVARGILAYQEAKLVR